MGDRLTGKQAFGLFTNIKLEIYTLFSLAVLGVFFKLLVNQDNDMTGTNGPASSTLWGYGLSAISLLCILFISYGLSSRELMNNKNIDPNINDGFSPNVRHIFREGNIFLIILIVLLLILSLNYTFFQKINIGIIPPAFNKFNGLSNLIIILQFLILFQYINISMFNNNSQNNKKNSGIAGIITLTTYLFSIINIIFVIIMYILLKYFSTDG